MEKRQKNTRLIVFTLLCDLEALISKDLLCYKMLSTNVVTAIVNTMQQDKHDLKQVLSDSLKPDLIDGIKKAPFTIPAKGAF